MAGPSLEINRLYGTDGTFANEGWTMPAGPYVASPVYQAAGSGPNWTYNIRGAGDVWAAAPGRYFDSAAEARAAADAHAEAMNREALERDLLAYEIAAGFRNADGTLCDIGPMRPFSERAAAGVSP